MAYSHTIVVVIADLAAGLLLLAALFGGNIHLAKWISVDKTLREVSVGLWALLFPAWFSIEERWAPKNQEQLAEFRESQQTGRIIWTTVGAAIFGVVIGGTKPTAPAPPTAPQGQPVNATDKRPDQP